jgi:hypothetical protein
MTDKKPRSVHPREKLPGKCNYPIWVTEPIHTHMNNRAKKNFRTLGKEFEYVLGVAEAAESDRITALNVPVLQEKRKLEEKDVTST